MTARTAASTLALCCFLIWLPEAAHAKTYRTSQAWSNLPPDLAGRRVKVAIANGGRPLSGVVEKVDASGITLQHRKGSRLIPRTGVTAIEWTTRKSPKWSIIGAAAGAVPGIFLTSVAVILDRNEGGIYGARNIGVAAGILAAGAVAGALAGRSADVDRYVITITGP